jgi:hypothetical protein
MRFTWLFVFSCATIHELFQIQQNRDVFKFIHRVSMNIYPRLIVNPCHFITTNSNVRCCTNNVFSCINDNLMCRFYNFPSNTITLMFLGVCLTFRYWNKTLWLQSWWEANLVVEAKKTTKNYKYLFFPFSNQILCSYHICHCVYFLTREKTFILIMLELHKKIKLSHNIIWFFFWHFHLPTCFWRVWNKELFFPFNLCAHLTLNHMNFPIKTNCNFYPQKLCCPIVFKKFD